MAGIAELMKSYGLAKEPEMPPSESEVTLQQLWEAMLKDLKDLSSATVEKNLRLTQRVNQLTVDLQVWQDSRSKAVETAEWDKKQHEQEKLTLQRRINILESMQGSMVLCVLDGDGTIFADHLLRAGLQGGREAARNLTNGMWDYLKGPDYDGHARFNVWLSIYFNKKGLLETLVRSDVCTADQFESFLVGISQASPRFVLVDVGHGKEAADAKIKEYIQTYTRFPQTLKIFFGGGHDNGYLPMLTALANERLLDKIVLLKGYSEVAVELKALKLPMLTLPNLFRDTKIGGSPTKRFVASPAPSEPASDSFPPGLRRNDTPLISGSGYSNEYKQPTQKLIPIDPTLPLTKRGLHVFPFYYFTEYDTERPAPCNEFFILKKCPRKETCKYSHSYDLSEEMIAQLRKNAKKAPCGSLKKGVPCAFGSRCIWGHSCPNGANCFHFKQGKCWFKTPLAHTELDSDGDSIHSPLGLSPSFMTSPEDSILGRFDKFKFN